MKTSVASSIASLSDTDLVDLHNVYRKQVNSETLNDFPELKNEIKNVFNFLADEMLKRNL